MSRKENKDELQEYIDQLTEDNKPIYTFADIDQKMKSGVFQRNYLSKLPFWLKIILAITITGSILYGLIQNIIVGLNF